MFITYTYIYVRYQFDCYKSDFLSRSDPSAAPDPGQKLWFATPMHIVSNDNEPLYFSGEISGIRGPSATALLR